VNPIADYLEQLAVLLRRSRRRRIVAEVRAHLLEAAAADPLHRSDPQLAALHAVERFGSPVRVASQFNAVRRRPRALIQRAAALMLASAGMATLGTATVWALEPGQAARVHRQQHIAPPRARANPNHHHR
jgi:hypothetical protein